MKWFNTRTFLVTLSVAASTALAFAGFAVASLLDVFNAIVLAASLAIAVIFAGLTASYRYPVRVSIWAYRAVMRAFAKRAIRSSLSHAMTHIPCLGILNREGTVALRIRTESSHEFGVGSRFNVYDSVNDQLWGVVEVVEMDDAGEKLIHCDQLPNAEMLKLLEVVLLPSPPVLVVEMFDGYGKSVGIEVFETLVWIGRFVQAHGSDHLLLPRRKIKLHLCGTSRATDSDVRQTLIDRFGPGKQKAIGKKRAPGPLYEITGDLWAALAVAVSYAEMRREGAL